MDAHKIAEINDKLKACVIKSADLFDIDGVVIRGRLLFNLVYAVSMELDDKKEFRSMLHDRLEMVHYGQVSSLKLSMDAIDLADNGFFVGLEKDRVLNIALRTAFKSVGSVNRFAKSLIGALRERPVERRRLLVAVTGAPEEIALPICNALGFDVCISSIYYTGPSGRYTLLRNLNAGLNKGLIIDRLETDCGMSWDGSIGAGDSERDLDILNRVSYPLAINPDEKLQARVRANRKMAFISDSQKKGIHIFRADANGRFHEVDDAEVLPPDIVPLKGGDAFNANPHC